MTAHTPKLTHLFESLPLAILYVDQGGVIVLANQKAHDLFSTKGASLIGTSMSELFGPQDQKALALLQRHEGTLACTFKGADGRPFPGAISSTRFEEEGKVFRQLLIRDGEKGDALEAELAEAIGEFGELVQKRTAQLSQEMARSEALNEELIKNQVLLVQVEKMATLGLMAAMVTHEINNPLAFVSSNFNALKDYQETFRRCVELLLKLSEAFKSGNPNDCQALCRELDALHDEENLLEVLDDCESVIKDCREGVDRLKELTRSLKDFTRLDTVEKEEADINEGIEATLRIAYPQIKTKCQIHTDLSPLPLVPCAQGQLNQVFLNLVVNAAQAIPKSGDVWVSSQVEGSEVVVKVKDNGAGIPKEKLSQIFDPFYTTKRKGEGTGLGLAICNNIVKMHHGAISVESEVGKGTCFTVRLPM